MLKTINTALIATLFLAYGCGDSTNYTTTPVDCGDGELVSLSSQSVCTYAQALVIENGFECPDPFDTLSTFGPMGICSNGTLSPDEIEETAREHRSRNPSEWGENSCIADRECEEGQLCSSQASCEEASSVTRCPDDLNQVSGPDACLMDDAVCFELAPGIWCTGADAAMCPDGFEPTDSCAVENEDCFRYSEGLLCKREGLTCEDYREAMDAEHAAISSCTDDAQCGQVMTGTSCGCTRDLVARLDADTTQYYSIGAEAGELGCATGSTCDCPAADGFACVNGFCNWNYTD